MKYARTVLAPSARQGRANVQRRAGTSPARDPAVRARSAHGRSLQGEPRCRQRGRLCQRRRGVVVASPGRSLARVTWRYRRCRSDTAAVGSRSPRGQEATTHAEFFFALTSTAPISQFAFCGRTTPRWSTVIPQLAVGMTSMRGLPCLGSLVRVGPPLFLSFARAGSPPAERSVGAVKPHEPSLSKL